jgi:Protein of unknown function (DUF4238)
MRARPPLPALRKRAMAIVRFKRRALITSDNPVTLLGIPDADEGTPLALGSNGGIYISLARRVGLVLRESEVFDGKQVYADVDGTTNDANALNQLVASRAHRYLYHHPDDRPLARIEVPTEPQTPSMRWEVVDPATLRPFEQRRPTE